MSENNSVGDVTLKQSQNLLTHCKSCHKRFDGGDHLPKLLPCHHSMCLECILSQQATAQSRFWLIKIFSPSVLSAVTCPECKAFSYQLSPEIMQTNYFALKIIQLELERLWCGTCQSVAIPTCQPDHILVDMTEQMVEVSTLLLYASNQLDEAYVKRLKVIEEQRQVFYQEHQQITDPNFLALESANSKDAYQQMSCLRDLIERCHRMKNLFPLQLTAESAKKELEVIIEDAKKEMLLVDKLMDNSDGVCQTSSIPSRSVMEANRSTMQIFVKNLSGVSILFNVKPSDTISSLMHKIALSEDIPMKDMRIIWAGKQLEREHTFAHYTVSKYSTVYLVLRLLSCKKCPGADHQY